MKLKDLNSRDLTIEERKQFKNYSKFFKEPLTFKHDLETYKTGRIFAQYVLFPNKPINNIYLKDLIIPEENYIFVSFDYSASQIRHLAVLNKAKTILRHFNTTNEDIYEKASKLFKTTRNEAKLIMLLLMFGGNEETIVSQMPNINLEQAKEIVKKHQKWFNLEEYDYQKRKELAHKIQKIESDYIKEKLISIYKNQTEFIRLHSVTHDEIVLEIHKTKMSEIDKIKEMLEEHPKVKMEVKVKISTTFQFEEKGKEKK